MVEVMRLAKVAVIWATVTYVLCVLIVWLLPSVYQQVTGWIIHMRFVTTTPVQIEFVPALLGLIFWDILVFLNVWFFAWLYNRVK